MQTDQDTMWVRMRDGAREYPPLQYNEIYRAAVDRKIKAEQRGSAWWVWRPDVELLAAKTAALRDGSSTPALLAEMDTAQNILGPTVKAICIHLIGAEVGFRSLQGDYAEAVTAGNLTLADAIRDTVETLRASSFKWNGSSWLLCDKDGNPLATTRPVTAKAGV